MSEPAAETIPPRSIQSVEEYEAALDQLCTLVIAEESASKNAEMRVVLNKLLNWKMMEMVDRSLSGKKP